MIRDHYLNINKITQDKSILKIFKIVQKYGGVVRFVGGAVRDALSNIKPTQLDFSTDLTPDELADVCEEAGIRTMPIGLKVDTLGVVINDNILTITSLRKKNKHYDDEIIFTDNWEEDAHERDLTINAVYADEMGNVFDYYDGVEDLEKGIVRFIDNPNIKIEEDYIRILRFFRFYSVFGKGEPDKKSLKACIKNKDGLKTLSIEVIRDELAKIIFTPNAKNVLKIMFDNNILSNWLEDAKNLDELERLQKIEENTKITPSLLRALLVLYMPDKIMAESIANRLKFTRKHKEHFIRLASENISLKDFENNGKKLVYKYGKSFCIDKFLTLAAIQEYSLESTKIAIREIKGLIVPILPISGKDIANKNIKDNNKIGNILKKLEDLWIESNFCLNRKELLQMIEEKT